MKKSPIIVFALLLCMSLPLWAQAKSPPQSASPITGPGEASSICDEDPYNLLGTNCGFEFGNFSGWPQFGDLSYTSVELGCSFSGGYGACFGPVGGLGFISQQVPTTPGESYNLNFTLRNARQPNHFQVHWGGQMIYDQINMPDFPYTYSSDLPGSEAFYGLPATSASTELAFGFLNVPDYFFLDDVSVGLAGKDSCDRMPAQREDCGRMGVDIARVVGGYQVTIPCNACENCDRTRCGSLEWELNWANDRGGEVGFIKAGVCHDLIGRSRWTTGEPPAGATHIEAVVWCKRDASQGGGRVPLRQLLGL